MSTHRRAEMIMVNEADGLDGIGGCYRTIKNGQ
jgi:hypothetical protein